MSTGTVVESPRFSIITPVHDPPVTALDACIASVLGQLHDSWEWVIVDDASSDPLVRSRLMELASDTRVTSFRGSVNAGIVGATNSALEAASGEFVAFLDHDDELTIDALAVLEAAILKKPDVDVIYTDEAKIDMDGNLYDWFAKPEWSPERLRGQNYCNHLTVLRRSLVERIGGLRAGFDGSQDHDLLLRASEHTNRILHVPEVLYHWRAVPGSTATSEGAKAAASDAGCRAVAEHLDRIGITAEVRTTRPGRYEIVRQLSRRPLVSVIIPTRGDTRRVRGAPTNLVCNAVESVLTTSTYERIEIVVVYDRATPTELLEALRSLAGESLRLVEWDEPFSFSKKVNLGVVRSAGDVIVMLNDDTEVISPDWIETLLGHLEEPDVGMVGPMLVLADGRIQSAGHHYDPSPLHLGAGADIDDPGPHGMFAVAGERSGVTAACAAIRRTTFDEVGGLSEAFPACYNDVDLGFKLLEKGYRIVWTPFAALHHFESLSRDPRETPAEAAELSRRWARRIGPDPFARQMREWWAEVPLWPPPRPGGGTAHR